MPLTWGGRKQAALEADKTFADGTVSRIAGGRFDLEPRESRASTSDDVRRDVSGEAVVAA